jgi:hypothetical protein
VRIDDIKKRTETEDYTVQRENLNRMNTQNVSSKAFLALMKFANHVDNRNRIRVGAY